MKICQVVPCFPYKEHLEGKNVEHGYHIGGVERHAFELSKALVKRGHSVTVLTTKSPFHSRYHEIEGIEIVRVPYGISLYSSSVPFNIFRCFNPFEYDLIHAHTPNPTIADLVCFHNKGKVPFILTYHNDITKDGFHGKIISMLYNKTLGDFLLTHSDLIITTTQNYAEKSVRLKNHKSKIRVVPNGVNSHKFTLNNENSVLSRYNFLRGAKIILFVGALEEYKGIEYLIRSFPKVLNSEKKCFLLIVGTGSLFEKLKALTVDLNISDNVVFAGYVKDRDLPDYYLACNLFVLPSISEKEGFGIVQLEAMTCKKPVICTNLPGVNEVDVHETSSIHISPKDSASLSEAIIKLLRDEKLSIEMGENGKKLINEKYRWDIVVSQLERVYSELTVSHENNLQSY